MNEPSPLSSSMRWLVAFASLLSAAAAIKCHSCLTHCKTTGSGTISAEKCDCVSAPKDMCEGNACFAKIELFADEKTAIMQKGCITDVPGGTPGCQYASNSDTIHCFCQGEKCNNRQALNDFIPARLPSVECCACSEKHGEHCSHDQCPRKCTGHYCVVDFDGLEQGCGLGFPRLQSFLRMPKYTEWQGQPICARYEATSGTVMNGCTCTNPSGHCNEFNATRQYQIKNVIERKLDEQNYCYSLVHKSMKAFGPEVFKRSGTCEGQYCFISYTTSEIVLESVGFEHDYADHDEFVGKARPRFEILAGCLKVDEDRKIVEGCTSEYSTNSSEPLAKHCICKSHLCNFHHLITDTVDTRPRSSSPTASSSRILATASAKEAAIAAPAAPSAPAATSALPSQPVAEPEPTMSNRVEDHVREEEVAASSALPLISLALLSLVVARIA